MVFCSVCNCGNSSTSCNSTNKGITFHTFPRDPDVKDKWITATGKRNWFPTKNNRLCSIHFREKDFNPTTKKRILLKHAYPTVEVWIEKPADKTQQLPSSSLLPSQPVRAMRLALDTETPREKKMRRIIQMKDTIINAQKLKIRRLLCRNRRCLKKMNELQEALKMKTLKAPEEKVVINVDIVKKEETDS